jgi:hypothetical protein
VSVLLKPTLFNSVGFNKTDTFFLEVSVFLKPTLLNSVGFKKTDTSLKKGVGSTVTTVEPTPFFKN